MSYSKATERYFQRVTKEEVIRDWEESNKKEDEVDMCPQDIWGWFKYLRYLFENKHDRTAEEIYVIAHGIASNYKPMSPSGNPIINFFDLKEKVKGYFFFHSDQVGDLYPEQVDWKKYYLDTVKARR